MTMHMSLDLDESKLQKEMNSMTLGLLTQREIWFQQIYWGVLPNIQEINHSCLPQSLPGNTQKNGEMLSTNSFYEVSIILVLKLDMGNTRKVNNTHQTEGTLTMY